MKQKLDQHTRKAIGARIKSLRDASGLNQKDFAARLGTIQQNLCRYETGETEIPLALLKTMTDQGVSLDWLFTGKEKALNHSSESTPMLSRFLDTIMVLGRDSHRLELEAYIKALYDDVIDANVQDRRSAI